MPYVRKRGTQLAIVHGHRDPVTKKVEQRILFTIYSKLEARELLGSVPKRQRALADGKALFEALMNERYPEIRFDWSRIREAVAENLDVLPDSYAHKAGRLPGTFRADLCSFTRQLALADPQVLNSSAKLIKEHRRELEFIRRLIDWRLRLCDGHRESEWNADPFFWRFSLSDGEVPSDVEEIASDLYNGGEFDEAECVFRLLTECFEDYAEGHNYLGLIALDQDDLAVAADHFRKTIEVGRRKFPKRIRKEHYWSLLETRPFMRGLRNLALTLTRAGDYDEALEVCDRLDRECGDDLSADSHRASAFLNLGRWAKACAAADSLHRLFPEENFIASFASLELGDREEATWRFLHAALKYPRAAQLVLGLKLRPLPERPSREQVDDHNSGVRLKKGLQGFFDRWSPAGQAYFRALLRRPRVVSLLEERRAVLERWRGDREPEDEWRAAFERMQEMETPDFAREQAELMRRTTPARPGRNGRATSSQGQR